jgi:hypothetical protein
MSNMNLIVRNAMGHPTEDELIQHLCGETEGRERDRLQEHLAGCVECRLSCEEITGALTMVNDAVPEPPDGFERIMWARVQQAVALEPPRRRWARWTLTHVVPAGALAAAAIIAISFVGRPAPPSSDNAGTSAPAVADADQGSSADRVLYTALDSHFQQTEMLLVELRNSSDRELNFERVSAEELVSAGRLYRISAQQSGHTQFAHVLDELEPVLVEMARSPERMSAQDRKWIRSRIEQDALLFKVRAATNDIRERVANDQ